MLHTSSEVPGFDESSAIVEDSEMSVVVTPGAINAPSELTVGAVELAVSLESRLEGSSKRATTPRTAITATAMAHLSAGTRLRAVDRGADGASAAADLAGSAGRSGSGRAEAVAGPAYCRMRASASRVSSASNRLGRPSGRSVHQLPDRVLPVLA